MKQSYFHLLQTLDGSIQAGIGSGRQPPHFISFHLQNDPAVISYEASTQSPPHLATFHHPLIS
jgi:hypothetical protein